MRTALAIACLAISVACSAQSLTKAEAQKVLDAHYAGRLTVRGEIPFPSVWYQRGDREAYPMEHFDKCDTDPCRVVQQLRDEGLVTVAKYGGMRANQYRPRGYVTYRADLTDKGKRYSESAPGKDAQRVILGRYRYVATKVVRDPNDRTQATIFYSQELTDPTPFYGKVDREGGHGKIVEPTGGRVDVYYDGERWRVRR